MSASAVPASSSAAQISRAHIERLGELRSQYDRLLAQRVEACRNEYTALSSNVLAHLIKTAPRSRPRKVGLMPFSGRPRSPLEWVRFPLRDNQALWRFATARLGVTAAARSERVPRDKARRPSREPHTDHGSQDWPWLYEDFRRKGVQAQPWEATLAADFEQAVTGPLRRALRASGNLANFVRQLRPVAEIQFDPADVLWWAKGGVLKGTSAPRIAFLREVLTDAPGDLVPANGGDAVLAVCGADYALAYWSFMQPAECRLRLGSGQWRLDVLDTWGMTVTPLAGTYTSNDTIPLPGRPFIAVRAHRVG